MDKKMMMRDKMGMSKGRMMMEKKRDMMPSRMDHGGMRHMGMTERNGPGRKPMMRHGK